MMSRGMKFRAWIPEQQVMVALETHGLLRLSAYGDVRLEFGQTFHDDDYQRAIEQFELMQSTGLTDKHGKEIYDGDILKGESGSLYQVTGGFSTSDFSLISFKDAEGLVTLATDVSRWEIVGTLYETPELLSLERSRQRLPGDAMKPETFSAQEHKRREGTS